MIRREENFSALCKNKFPRNFDICYMDNKKKQKTQEKNKNQNVFKSEAYHVCTKTQATCTN